jgi:hypothetical protein
MKSSGYNTEYDAISQKIETTIMILTDETVRILLSKQMLYNEDPRSTENWLRIDSRRYLRRDKNEIVGSWSRQENWIESSGVVR